MVDDELPRLLAALSLDHLASRVSGTSVGELQAMPRAALVRHLRARDFQDLEIRYKIADAIMAYDSGHSEPIAAACKAAQAKVVERQERLERERQSGRTRSGGAAAGARAGEGSGVRPGGVNQKLVKELFTALEKLAAAQAAQEAAHAHEAAERDQNDDHDCS